MHPDLRMFADDWATRCIVQARLKATSSYNKKDEQVADVWEEAAGVLEEAADARRRTRSNPKPKRR